MLNQTITLNQNPNPNPNLNPNLAINDVRPRGLALSSRPGLGPEAKMDGFGFVTTGLGLVTSGLGIVSHGLGLVSMASFLEASRGQLCYYFHLYGE
jgi:hypothetical protein